MVATKFVICRIEQEHVVARPAGKNAICEGDQEVVARLALQPAEAGQHVVVAAEKPVVQAPR